MASTQINPDFVSVRLSQIPYYKNTELYYQTDEGEWVLYKQSGEVIDGQRLKAERIPRLFVKLQDREAAALEAQAAFSTMLESSLHSGDVKTVHSSLVGIAEETLSEPRSGTMRGARRSVALLTRASLREPVILKQLVNLSHLDYTTALHSVNVMTLTLGFAHKVGFDWRRTLQFGLAALLHDIGKMQLPEKLLKSPCRLTEEQFRLIKLHPMMAVDVLKRAGMSLPKVHAAATEHHEKMDGTGYPRGIKDISLVGQIVGLIDAYEALTNEDRPYRRAVAPEQALLILKKDTDRGRYMSTVYDKFLLSLTT